VSAVTEPSAPIEPAKSPSPAAQVSDLARLRMLSRIAEQVGEGVVVADNDGWFQYVNPAFARQHASTVPDLTGAHMSEFYSPEEMQSRVQPIIAAALKDGIGRGEVTRRRRDGTDFPAQLTLSLLRNDAGELIGRVLCIQDVTERKRLEEELRQAALLDPLTQLPNRRLLRDRMEHALALLSRRRTGLAALFVDLDDFKVINDQHGHAVGDEVLVEVARRLGGCIRAADTLARYGGDEFVLILEEVDNTSNAGEIGARVLECLAGPVQTSAGPLHVSASVGIHAASVGSRADELISAADAAMYEAKRAGRGRVFRSVPTE
jgi:diguanylate cyclase (GGDEF)-like protein/PAS domain S-box-containing protein